MTKIRMTKEQFDETKFTGGMTAEYKGGVYAIASVDFEERLIGLLMNIPGAEPNDVSWVRCENCHVFTKHEFFDKAVDYLKTKKTFKCAELMNQFDLGFNSAGRLVDELESAGLISEFKGAEGREVLIQAGGV